MAVDFKVTAVGREPNGGRRFITVEMVFGGPLGTITKNITHLNPRSAEFPQQLRQYVRAFAQGARAARQMRQQPDVPALTAEEQTALLAAPAVDAERD